MYEKIAKKLTQKYISNGTIVANKQEVYEYGFEVLISTFVYSLIFILISVALNKLLPSLVFWISFFIIRKISGGYHANSYFTCHVLFCLNHFLFILSLDIFQAIQYCFFPTIFTVFASLLLLIFAPVDHPNKPFIKDEKSKYRKISVIYSILLLLSAILCLVLLHSFNVYIYSFSFGSISAAISVMSAKIKHKGVFQK